jgi:nitrogen fixation protein NifB
MEVVYDLDRRRAYQQQVEAERQAQHDAKLEALAGVAGANDVDPDMKVLVAVATEGHGKVNQHFGHATEFQIFEVSWSPQGASPRPPEGAPAALGSGPAGGRAEVLFVGHRRVDLYCQGGYGEDEQLPSIVGAINDCHAVLVAKIGACPRDELNAAGIEPVDAYAHEFIEKAALAWFAGYRARVASGAIAHQPRGDARIRQGAFTGGAEAAA